MRKLTDDEKFMKAAMREAKKAWKLDEVPIGCVIRKTSRTLVTLVMS